MDRLLDRLQKVESKTSGNTEQGAWRLIQFALDPATGEKINVGVALTTASGTAVRLIENLSAFRCMYGPDSMENISFSFDLMRDLIDSERPLIAPSSNFMFGAERMVRFVDADALIDSLYCQMVPLARYDLQRLTEEKEAPRRSINTPSLRSKVLGNIRARNKRLFHQICRDDLVTVRDDIGEEHQIEMPIWAEAELYKGHRYGSIVSTWQISQDKRSLDLNLAYRFLDTANKVGAARDGRGGLFILRPDPQVNPEYKELMLQIDNEIDEVGWMMKKAGVHLDVSESIEELTEYAVDFAA